MLKDFWQQVVIVWETGVMGVSVGNIVTALAVLFVFLLLRWLFSRFVIAVLRLIASRTKTSFDDAVIDAVSEPLRFVFVIIGIYAASRVAPFPDQMDQFLDKLVRSLIAFTIFWTLYRCVDPLSFLFDRLVALFGSATLRESLRGFFAKLAKFVIACLGVAAVLEEWDFNVAAVLGGLGLVGMAVAFGAQNLIANLFADITIFLDHMFEKGEWIRSPDVEGIIEDIGFRTTKIRRFDKALVTIPNAKLAGEAVVNFSRMTNRRIYWKIGLEYRTTQAQLAAVVRGIHDFVHTDADFETDPARVTTMVHVDSFNDSSIDIMLYCFTKTTKWTEWMGVKERLAFRIKEIIEDENGAGFAFPSQSVYVETLPFGTPEAFPTPAGTAA